MFYIIFYNQYVINLILIINYNYFHMGFYGGFKLCIIVIYVISFLIWISNTSKNFLPVITVYVLRIFNFMLRILIKNILVKFIFVKVCFK